MLSYENRSGGMAPPTPPNTADHIPISTQQRAANKIIESVTTNGSQPATKNHHIWLITGPAGCGKTTVAQYLAEAMNLPYIEGDEYHPKANVDKMSQGIPLTDADRWDWLVRLREEATHRLNAGSQGVVVTCSALKRKYRDVIRVAGYYDQDVRVHFVYLHAPEEVLLERVANRKGHYMGANMVHSQLGILEPPAREERDVISVNVSGNPEDVKMEALAKITFSLEQEPLRDC